MDDIENIRKHFDVFQGESGNLVLKPKKPRIDFQDILMPSTSTGKGSSSGSSMIVIEEEDASMNVANSNSMETSGQV